MSPSGRTEHVAFLRAAIARIEAGLPGPAPRAGVTPTAVAPLPAPAAVSSRRRPARPPIPLGPEGFGLDRMLGGGLRPGALHEMVPATARDEGAASAFALAVAVRCLRQGQNREGGALIWIVEDNAAGESGAPYRPGLQAHGLDPDRLIVVRTKGAEATLWATEEALRARGLVVLAELWGGRRYGLAPSRRLVLAARHSGGTALLLHAGLGSSGGGLSSGSETRFTVAACPSPPGPALGGRLPVPGLAAFAVRLDKVRNATRDVDRERIFPLLWNAGQRCFHDHDLPVALASLPTNGPASAAGLRAR